MTAGPISSPLSWEDSNSVSPPACTISTSSLPQYSVAMFSNTTEATLIYEGGESLVNTLTVPYTYLPLDTDVGASLHVSINSGATWTTAVIATAGAGQIVTSSLTFPLAGGSTLIVQVTSP